uniref:Uncharacterized protein n=1 Tax=Varanus komodoensis TaxID=61221 RepID=A0A8D2L717_VARKO
MFMCTALLLGKLIPYSLRFGGRWKVPLEVQLSRHMTTSSSGVPGGTGENAIYALFLGLSTLGAGVYVKCHLMSLNFRK